MFPAQAELDRFPQMRQILRRHRHRQRDGQRRIHRAAALDGSLAHRAQIAAAQVALASLLHAVELQIDLKFSVAKRLAQPRGEGLVGGDADAVGV